MFFKKLTVPKTNETRQIDAVQLWEVRWRSRHGEYFGETSPEVEAFPSEAEAHAFAESLRNAFRLVRNTSGNKVTVERATTVKVLI